MSTRINEILRETAARTRKAIEQGTEPRYVDSHHNGRPCVYDRLIGLHFFGLGNAVQYLAKWGNA